MDPNLPQTPFIPKPPLPPLPQNSVPPETPSTLPPRPSGTSSERGLRPASPGPSKKSRKFFIGIAGLIVLIATLAGGLYAVSRQQLFQPKATTGTEPPDIVAQCISLIAQKQDANGTWFPINPSTDARPGDVIRFTTAGSSNGGTFTKAAFFINNGQPILDTTPADGFFTIYTIPSAGELNVGAVLYHSTEGWVK